MASKLTRVDGEFSCGICSKAYDERDYIPKVLQCLHVFCQPCLEKHTQKDVISCCICQGDTKLGSNGIQSLHSDPSKLRMKQFAEISKQNGKVPCHDCPDKANAKYFCQNCNVFFCQDCRNHHLSQRSRDTKDHMVIGISMATSDVLRSAIKPTKCSEHDQPSVFYCSSSDCRMAICAACTFDHKEQGGHMIRKLADARRNAEIELCQLTNITKEHCSKIDKFIKTEKVNMMELEEQKEAALRSIDEEFHQLSKSIKRRRDALVKDTKREFQSMKEESIRRVNELTVSKEKRHMAIRFKDRIVEHTSDIECTALTNVIRQRLDVLIDEKIDKQPITGFTLVYRQQLSDDVLKTLSNTMSSIESQTTKIYSSDVTTSGAVENTRSNIANVRLLNQQGMAEMVDLGHLEATVKTDKGSDFKCEVEQNTTDKLVKIYLTANTSGKCLLKIMVFGQLLENKQYSITVEKEQDSEDEIASSELLEESRSSTEDVSNDGLNEAEVIVEAKKVHSACKNGNIGTIQKVLLSLNKTSVRKVLSHVIVEEKNQESTPLFTAIRNKRENVVQLLLEKWKPDLEQTVTMTIDKWVVLEVPPLWYACQKAHFPIVKLLLQHGADINKCTSTGSSPVRVACFNCSLEVIQYLVEHGADINLSTKYKSNCLLIATYLGRLEIVQYLTSKGAILDYQDSDGNAALHHAATEGHKDILDFLLSSGAVMSKNKEFLTPPMVAANDKNSDMVEYIISKPHVSPEEKIKAMELLGSSYESESDIDEALKYLKMAMKEKTNLPTTLRYPDYPGKSEAYFLRHRKICHTVVDLENLRQNPNAFFMNSLAVKERILGPKHVHLEYNVTYRGAVYADIKDFHNSIDLVLHSVHILKLNGRWDKMADRLTMVCEIFVEMISSANKPPNFSDVFSALSYSYDCLCSKEENQLELSDKKKSSVYIHMLCRRCS